MGVGSENEISLSLLILDTLRTSQPHFLHDNFIIAMLKKFIFGLISGLILTGALVGGVVVDRKIDLSVLDKWLGSKESVSDNVLQREVLKKESVEN